MAEAQWHGDLWLAKDFAVLFGRAGATSPHAHYAHQVLLSTTEPVTVSLDGVVTTARCVLIPSMRRHAVLHTPEVLFTIFAEPMAIPEERLFEQVSLSDGSLPALSDAVRGCRTPVVLDARVSRALASVDVALAGKVSAKSLADSVHISLSQLERLLGAQIGLPVRQLVLWRRLRVAVGLVLGGQTLTSAAHAAGFSDSAHFSRTMRATFGVRADRSLRHMAVRLLD